MDTSLEWKIVVGQIRFTSGHRTVGEEEEPQQSWKNVVRDFVRSRNLEEHMAEDDIFGIWECIDGSWL